MTRVGTGELTFEPVPNWAKLPAETPLTEAIGVAVDSRDRVFIFNRGKPEVLVLDRDGNFLMSWGEGQFVRPHGIWIAADDTLYCTDDEGHAVRQFAPDGSLLRTIGPSGIASDSGAEGFDHRSIRAGVGPYNLPTNVVTNEQGEIFVADGYGNARVHHFDADGNRLASWGEPGSGRLQFRVPHGLGIDRESRLYVADRENSRIQILSGTGEWIEEWTDVVRPCQVFVGADDLVYVTELGNRIGLFPWMEKPGDAVGSRLSIFDRSGELLCRWGGGDDPTRADEFCAGHDISVDSRGDVYVGEVSRTATRHSDLDGSRLPSLRKFARIG